MNSVLMGLVAKKENLKVIMVRGQKDQKEDFQEETDRACPGSEYVHKIFFISHLHLLQCVPEHLATSQERPQVHQATYREALLVLLQLYNQMQCLAL